MGLRSESRLRAAGPVQFTILGQHDVPVPAQVTSVSGEEMQLLLERAAHLGAAVRIDVDGTVLLGEVCYCAPKRGAHAVGVRLHHAVTLSDELARLMQGLLGESSPPDQDAPGPQSHDLQASDRITERCRKHRQQRNE